MDSLKIFILLGVIFLIQTAASQAIFIKPYVGYSTVKMREVNEDADFKMDRFRQEVGKPIPYPENFNGNYAWGFDAAYKLEENYFITAGSYFFREKNHLTESDVNTTEPFTFRFDREIQLFQLSIGIQYFFNYNSWKRVNTFIGSGIGLGVGWSKSDFKYSDDNLNTPDYDNSADFSNMALTAYFSAGTTIQLLPMLMLQAEIGARFANLQELSGQLRTLEKTNNDYTTLVKYDFSGFYITVGTAFILPLQF